MKWCNPSLCWLKPYKRKAYCALYSSYNILFLFYYQTWNSDSIINRPTQYGCSKWYQSYTALGHIYTLCKFSFRVSLKYRTLYKKQKKTLKKNKIKEKESKERKDKVKPTHGLVLLSNFNSGFALIWIIIVYL